MEGVPPDSDEDRGSQQPQAAAVRYYEALDLLDARHPQTILAYEMNDAVLPIAYGAPLRLRVERQLGYKMAKYLMRIELVRDFSAIGGGRGGYWEDRGYDWYAGI
jgi:DMSO/TMAO reductase YedYZ molybdopterin-dependent catalytic subunit